jgi:hypothetical protein
MIQSLRDDEEAVVRHRGMIEGVEDKLLNMFDHCAHVVGNLVSVELYIRKMFVRLSSCCEE